MQHLQADIGPESPSIISPGRLSLKAQRSNRRSREAIRVRLFSAEPRIYKPFPCHMTPRTCARGGQHPLLYAGCITVKLCEAGLEAASFSGTPRGIPEQQLLSTLNSSQGSMPASLQRNDMIIKIDPFKHVDAHSFLGRSEFDHQCSSCR